MPLYEFYCRKCNTVYNFFSRTVNTEKVPLCPSCKTVKLKRQMSLFAKIAGKKEDGNLEEGGMPPIDEAKMEKAMSMLAHEADKINEDDPRQAAKLMRKLADVAGIGVGKGVEEALNRMEKGEDPETIEQEMEHILSEEEPFILESKARIKRLPDHARPRVDDSLYEL
ncbi:MAG: zinc ribbon domain-containing protein [Syntrophales bacterium LBB04]|nr:zinc ribbon domain-containing protein [Syntrophales bacterium LBB04]